MRPTRAAVGTVLFAATVPATVAGVVPWLLAGRPTQVPPDAPVAARLAGGLLLAGGSALVADAFVRFVRAHGTPAPIAETESLVTAGPYRVTRNPQYVGVVSVAAGQALWWWDRRPLAYAAVSAAVFHTWIRVYEEPRLRQRFGEAYVAYVDAVPRWFGRRVGTRW